MAWGLARTSEYVVATVAVLLSGSVLLGACSSTPREDTTASISRQPAPVGSSTPLPPVIGAPQTTASYQQPAYAAQPVAYAPQRTAYVPPPQTCACSAPRRYDVTASIPRTRTAPPPRPRQMQFLVHTIQPHDTLYSVSRQYHTRVSDIATVNRMNENSRLRQGELLVVPTAVR